MGVYFDFDEVDAFTVGARRPAGPAHCSCSRPAAERERVTVKCEKQQAAAIADYLRKRAARPAARRRPTDAAAHWSSTEPCDAAFVLGPIGLGYDRSTDRVLVQLDEFVPGRRRGRARQRGASTSAAGSACSSPAARCVAFCEHADGLVAAGRPSCMWCNLPIDPDGHVCPRMN